MDLDFQPSLSLIFKWISHLWLTFQVESTLDDCLSPLPGEVTEATTVAASATASAAIKAGLFVLPTPAVPSKTV